MPAVYKFRKPSGFTLIELLVVVSIITVISAIGLVSFQTVRNNALEAKRKGDIDAIKKAYESNYDPTANGGQGGYKQLSPTKFADNKIPVQPDGQPYTSVIGPGSTDAGSLPAGSYSATSASFKICTPLGNNSSASCEQNVENCYCTESNQGDQSLVQTHDNLASSCDTNGTLSNDLIGYWRLNESTPWTSNCSGLVVADFSGKGSPGKRCINGSGPTGIDGKAVNFGKAASFDGTNDYVEIDNPYKFSTTDSFTITAWVKSSKKIPAGQLFSVVDKGFGFTNTYGLIYRTTGDNKANAFFGVHGNSSEQAWTINNVDISDNQWHLIAGVRDVITDKIYVYTDNNAAVGVATDPTSVDLNSGSNIRFGARGGGLAQYFPGSVDEVRIYKRALSHNEIKSLYNSGNGCFPPL